MAVAAVFLAALPGASRAAWPFTSAPEEPYIARVGDRVITTERFAGELSRLHKSGRVGKALSESGGEGFVREDYRKFLEEIIDNELIIMEAERLGFAAEPEVAQAVDNYRLNLFLERLRDDEIFSKVDVAQSDLEEEYIRREREKQGQVEEPADVDRAAMESELRPGSHTRKIIHSDVLARKGAELERRFFERLRKRARVRVYDDALEGLSAESPVGTVVAMVNGEPLYSEEVARYLQRGAAHGRDEAALKMKSDALEKVILHRLLDMEARGRGYEKEPQIKAMIEHFRGERLIEAFKKKAVARLVKVEEKDILDYYNSNPDEFQEPDSYNIGLIALPGADEAKGIAKELEEGADFGYMAKLKSIDPSKERGGDVGWVRGDSFPGHVSEALAAAADGDLIAPFQAGKRFYIVQYRGKRKGGMFELDRVRDGIMRVIAVSRYEEIYGQYLARLRQTVPVEINEEELGRILGN